VTAEAEVVDAEAVEIGQELELAHSSAVSLFGTNDPGEVLKRATATAKPLADVIKRQKLHKRIGDKEHVLVEGWTLLGSMLGVFPVCVWTKPLENGTGWEARVEARTRDGQLIGAAEAMCTRAESTWKGRDEYAIRSMAQTRATSKALRQPLGFVIQLAGFEPMPAEEAETTTAASAGDKKAADKPAARGQSTTKAGDRSAGERGSRARQKTEEAPGESQFKAPAGPRGGQSTQLEADELSKKLVALVTELGATDSLEKIEEKRVAGDVPWLKRQTTAAEKHLEGKAARS